MPYVYATHVVEAIHLNTGKMMHGNEEMSTHLGNTPPSILVEHDSVGPAWAAAWTRQALDIAASVCALLEGACVIKYSQAV